MPGRPLIVVFRIKGIVQADKGREHEQNKADGKQMSVMEDNQLYRQRMQEYGFATRELIEVPLPSTRTPR